MDLSFAKRLKNLECESVKLKSLLTKVHLDIAALNGIPTYRVASREPA